ncbi:MAG: glycosyltransferase [Ilumatobacteraceae bacterium]|nr:glycosyltransferase [Ilumatobacteraceae bacterium]
MLGGCLESLRALVDEVIVVDTGSVDGTQAIAASYGAKVVHHPWRNDFAEARNVSLDHATGQWVLYIDADERVVSGDRNDLQQLLASQSHTAFRVLLKPTLDSTPYREYRLWRHDPRIRFEGVIHERVSTAIHRVAQQDGRDIGLADVLIQHIGYEGDQTRKHLRNLPLLRRQLADEPDNLFVWHHLSRVLDGLGQDDEAEQVLQQAVAVAAAQTRVDPLGVLVYTDLIAKRRDRGAPVTDLLAQARATYPTNCILLYIEGQQLTQQGQYQEAVDRFEELLAVDPNDLPPGSPSYDQRLFGDLAHEGHALALFRAGRYAQAADAYAAAEALMPSIPEYSVKRQLAQARARTTAPAQSPQ